MGKKPVPPTDLDAVAKKAFLSVVADLESQGTLQVTDAKLIEQYARAYSLSIRVERQLAKEPLTLTSDNGRQFINPLVNAITGTNARLRQLLNDLKLSPRTRGQQEDDEIDPRWQEPE